MSRDRQTHEGAKKGPLASEGLCRIFVKFGVEQLLKIWLEKDKEYCNTKKSSLRDSEWNKGDTDVKKLKLSISQTNEPQQKPEWVWLQGYAINLSKDFETLEISDHPVPAGSSNSTCLTPTVIIANCQNSPSNISGSSKGKYCQGKFKNHEISGGFIV